MNDEFIKLWMGDALVDRGDSAQWVLVKDSEDMSKLRKTIKRILLFFFFKENNVIQAVVMFLRWYFEKKKLK